jgi:hypothetical protein
VERMGAGPGRGGPRQEFLKAPMTQEDSQTETGEVLLALFVLLEGTSESTRAKTARMLHQRRQAGGRHD